MFFQIAEVIPPYSAAEAGREQVLLLLSEIWNLSHLGNRGAPGQGTGVILISESDVLGHFSVEPNVLRHSSDQA